MINFKNWKYLDTGLKVLLLVAGIIFLGSTFLFIANLVAGTAALAILNFSTMVLMYVTAWSAFEC